MNEIDKLNNNVILYKKEGDIIKDNNNNNDENIKNKNEDIKEIINIGDNNTNNENLEIKNEDNLMVNKKNLVKEDDEENKHSSIDIIL